MLDFGGSGMSVMELSHRSAEFQRVIDQAEQDCRDLLNVPEEEYAVLFLQGGATGQFAAVAMNLVGDAEEKASSADYVVTGRWSAGAAKEARKFVENVNIIASSECEDGTFGAVPPVSEWKINKESKYVYFCANETVHGVAFNEVPEVPDDVVLVGDYSSCFMSAPLDVTKFGVVIAGAQKNVGPAGVTVVIVRKDLLGRASKRCPAIMNYTVMAAKQSMLNTPPCWAIYMVGLVFQWLKRQGGLEAMAKVNRAKAKLIYDAIDKHDAYRPHVTDAASRSIMNICFSTNPPERQADFLAEAAKRNMVGLKGHRSVGGLRAGVYNACSLEQAEALVQLLDDFAAAATVAAAKE
eukprot:TRINITY_DN69634_c0_g1_i1.p1 TRINITY_DN69634_c0_g1~~TRINITY_DN69634_c0_g1_i1.p1  ORF type:complete len:378 (+),score=202.20 TRINITY_DN69634_c0_g1_i1:81-1136(+)